MNETFAPPLVRKLVNTACIGASLVALLATSAIAPAPGATRASSHREAPLISLDQEADVTDVYAFVSPDISSTVTLIANWIPFEDPTGGPNFWHFDDTTRYYIKVDRDGDAIEDVSWEWTFSPLTIKNPNTFLYNTLPVRNITDTQFNIVQTYTVTEITGPTAISTSVRNVILANKLQPPNNVGPRSLPNYDLVANQAIYTSSNNYKIFTGQRDDPFFVDIGSIFDLGALRPFNNLHLLRPPAASPGIDSVGGYNIHTTMLQLPKTTLAPTCTNVSTDTKCVVGVWATSERPSLTVRAFGSVKADPLATYVQVARLGNPLVNEAVLPLALKDAFNGLEPKGDTPLAAGTLAGPAAGALFVKSVFTPELQGLLPVLYPGVFTQTGATANLPATPRSDLFTIFLTGIPGVNAQTNSGNPFSDTTKVAADMLRLNVAIAPTASVCQGKIMGALDGDLGGFPNGRRLEDDVTDIALRAVAGGYGPFLNTALGLPNLSPGNLLTDGVQKNDKPCLTSFPYIPSPHSGYDDVHPAPSSSWLMWVVKNVEFPKTK
jgi:hypothetical protein